jgi:hypothetical protein
LTRAANGNTPTSAADGSKEQSEVDATEIAFAPAYIAEAGWTAVVARVGIPCGSDAQLLIYARRDGRWQRLLRWASADYARIDGAWESLEYRVSPRDANGRRFVAVHHIRPWCSSTWSTIDYAVLRPTPGSDRPEVVLQGSDSLWWGGEDLGRLSVDARHVDLRFHAASIDGGLHSREFIRRYDLAGDKPVRVAPIAANARDFVDEWIVSDWTDAQRWTSPPHDSFRTLHQALQAQRRASTSFEFGQLNACTAAAQTQVELRSDDGRAWFFRVRGDGDFRVQRISDTPDPDCTKTMTPPG